MNLSKPICIRCKNAYAKARDVRGPWAWKPWTAKDKEWWRQGWVKCPYAPLSCWEKGPAPVSDGPNGPDTPNRKITAIPPGCPFAAEHAVSQPTEQTNATAQR